MFYSKKGGDVVFVNNYYCKLKHNWQHCTYCDVIVFSLEEYTFVRERMHRSVGLCKV